MLETSYKNHFMDRYLFQFPPCSCATKFWFTANWDTLHHQASKRNLFRAYKRGKWDWKRNQEIAFYILHQCSDFIFPEWFEFFRTLNPHWTVKFGHRTTRIHGLVATSERAVTTYADARWLIWKQAPYRYLLLKIVLYWFF